MKETLYLIVDRNGVQGMRKSLVDVKRGQALVKLNLNMPSEAFNPPVLSQDVTINDWRAGIDMEDVEFRSGVITEDEAQIIRERRIKKMSEILEGQGWLVKSPEQLESEQHNPEGATSA